MAKAEKLPRRVLGVKLPKRLSRAGGRVKSWAQGPLTSDLIAAALLGLGGAIVHRAVARRLAARTGTEPVLRPGSGQARRTLAGPGEAA